MRRDEERVDGQELVALDEDGSDERLDAPVRERAQATEPKPDEEVEIHEE